MFVVALVAILILGGISVGLLKLLSKSIGNRRDQSRQEPKTTLSEVNPEQAGNEQLATLINKIDEYHDEDTKRSLANRFETLMYVLWGFAIATVGLALAMISVTPRTGWTLSATIVSIIGAIGFSILAVGATRKCKQYRLLDWKDFWGDKNY